MKYWQIQFLIPGPGNQWEFWGAATYPTREEASQVAPIVRCVYPEASIRVVQCAYLQIGDPF